MRDVLLVDADSNLAVALGDLVPDVPSVVSCNAS